jgi:ATP-binding cassette subfamily D (ALD) protein 3
MKFTELIKHQTFIMYKKLYMGCFDSILVKYGAAICGYSVVGIPVFSKASKAYLTSINNNQSQV